MYRTPRRENGLTERQLSVLALCASGCSHDEIGVALHMPTPTVRFDLYALRETIGARSVTHAVAICVTAGLLSLAGGSLEVLVQPEREADADSAVDLVAA